MSFVLCPLVTSKGLSPKVKIPEAEFLDEIQAKTSVLLIVTFTAVPWDFYFFKLTQHLTVSVKKKGGKPDRKPYPLPSMVLEIHIETSSLRTLKSQDYA